MLLLIMKDEKYMYVRDQCATAAAALSIKGCYLEDPNQHPILLVPINSRRKENVTVTAAIVLNGAPSQLARSSAPYPLSLTYMNVCTWLSVHVRAVHLLWRAAGTGAYPPFGDPIANIWHGYASHGVVIEANFFSLSHENGSAGMLASADNVIISA